MFVEKCQIKVKPWHRLLSRDLIWYHSALESDRVVRRKLDLKLLCTSTPILISLFCLFIAVSIAESCTEAIANISQVFTKRSHYKNISKRLLFYHLLFFLCSFPLFLLYSVCKVSFGNTCHIYMYIPYNVHVKPQPLIEEVTSTYKFLLPYWKSTLCVYLILLNKQNG